MGKKELAPKLDPLMQSSLVKSLANDVASYDDSEDRALTADAIVEWKTVYIATAIVYTDVSDKIKGYLKQQKRWKKGYIRSNFYVSAFFCQKNPLMSLIFYTEFMTTFAAPLITLIVLVFEPLVIGTYWLSAFFVFRTLLTGLVQGLDYRFRDTGAKNWKYKPLINLILSFILSWMMFPALWNYRKNEWLTRQVTECS